MKLKFRENIPINITSTLNQLLAPFGGVRDGLPELIKNAKDQYSRIGVTEPSLRVILVIVNTTERSVGVIDFAGAKFDQFSCWEVWSDPSANSRERAADIEGGHGNGGKGFMVLGSTSTSLFESCFQGRRTRMGYKNDSKSSRFYPGIALERGEPVEDIPIPSAKSCLDAVLSELGVEYSDLPEQARRAFESRDSFTVAQVNGVRDWVHSRAEVVSRLARALRQDVESHPQAAQTLESCSVWFIVDTEVIGDGPARFEYPEPFSGFPDPAVIPVPQMLSDPTTGESVLTREESGPEGSLTLRTSARSLRTGDLRPLHLIRIRNLRNIVGLWSVADLSSGASSGFIYGELVVPVLHGEHLVGADRKSLNSTPLVRALSQWTAEQIKHLAEKIQQATAREHRAEDRNRVNGNLQRLRDLMRKYLDDRDSGTGGQGGGSHGAGASGSGAKPTIAARQGKRIDEIILEEMATGVAIPLGATVPLHVRAYEVCADGAKTIVHSPRLELRQNPPSVLSLESDYQVKAKAAGTVSVYFESEDGTVRSNAVVIDVVSCEDASMVGAPVRPLLQGERVALRISYATAGGPREDLLHDVSIDETGMGRISRNATCIAGSQPGAMTVRARWGSGPLDTRYWTLMIGSERVPPRKGVEGGSGGGMPLILLCGTPVPGMEHFPIEQRTIMPTEHQPTIIDYDPAFENVIFINPDSKESVQARRGKGRKGMAGIATETYYQFVALKCFEILKRLWVFGHARQAPLTEVQFRERFATAETECAPFIEAAYDVAEAIAEAGTNQS